MTKKDRQTDSLMTMETDKYNLDNSELLYQNNQPRNFIIFVFFYHFLSRSFAIIKECVFSSYI